MFKKLFEWVLSNARNYLGSAQERLYNFSDGPRIEQPDLVPYNSVRWAEEGVELGVESSNVVTIRYDNILSELVVNYRPSKQTGNKTRIYLYPEFPYEEALRLFKAPSLGRHINRNRIFHQVGSYRRLR